MRCCALCASIRPGAFNGHRLCATHKIEFAQGAPSPFREEPQEAPQREIVESTRWKEVTPSEYPWEREALGYLRAKLPDREPYRAWANFEFIAGDGSINEVDVLVLSPKGFYLVEIKSRPGNVEGDAGTWTWVQEGRRTTTDNPLIVANRKAKKLIDLLRRQRALSGFRLPFLQAVVFLSAEDVRIRLPEQVKAAVYGRDPDDSKDRSPRSGIIGALTRWPDDAPPRHRIDRPMAKAITRAMDQAGIRQSHKARRVGDYQLEELIYEGPNYQDWSATHVSLEADRARVRIYLVELGASEDARSSIARAAKREYQILRDIFHPGILRAKHYTDHERGPALLYEYDPRSQRLDHYLRERGEGLTVDARLDLIRQVAETVQYAHSKRLYHRALCPQNILVVDPEATTPRLQILNWQTASRESSSRGLTALGLSATSHVGNLIEEESAVYLAPEALTERGESGELADVFSLGAIAYHLFSGKAPAASFVELTDKLREGQGLQVSGVLDGAAESLRCLIQYATHPDLSVRLDTVTDFLQEIERFEDEITTPDPDPDVVRDPTQAKANDRILHGYVVKRRLGKGATSVGLLVERDGKESVLKVALEPSHNARLRSEAELLKKLRRHQFIVELKEVLEFDDRVALRMDKAGDQTLAQRLREEGRLHLELLERFGDDLLQAVKWLEEEGVPHRDIKPENLGVAPMGRGDHLHLVLYDFSLASNPAEDIRAGTVPYLDPFLALRKPPRWDSYAERFAAAMTLYQMATGALPQWGDGQSEPSVLAVEVTLDGDAFEPALREPMLAFFGRALRRDYRERYDNAEEMLRAWRAMFAAASAPEVVTEHGEEARTVTELEDATPETRLSELAFSTRALNAAERANLRTVRDLLHFPLPFLRRLRGVGSKTRRELSDHLAALAQRFPDVAAEPKRLPKEALAEAPAADESVSVDELIKLLLPEARTDAAKASAKTVDALLGLSQDSKHLDWPSQSDVARALGHDPAVVSQTLAKVRKRWLKLPAVTRLREDIVALLDTQGGVMTARELTDALLASRGSVQSEPLRTHHLLAVLRAATETERERAAARWLIRRYGDGGNVLVVRDELAPDGTQVMDGEKLADYAEALGRCADVLARDEPLRPPTRALESLLAVEVPEGVSQPATSRLLQLAAATSSGAALSSRLELYPRKMSAQRALKLSVGALAGARELTPEQVSERVAGRFPESEPLPTRPELDRLLDEAGAGYRWEPQAANGAGAYRAPLREFTTVSSVTSLTRSQAATARFEPVSDEQLTVEGFEQRLRASIDNHSFLVLTVAVPRATLAARLLTERFPVQVLSFDALMIRHMKAFTDEKRIDWRVVLRADGVAPDQRAASRDWGNLQRVVKAVLPRIQAELSGASKHVLLTDPGLLARYEQMSFITELQSATGRPGGPPGLWLLIPSDGQQHRPMLDGQPVPVYTSAQWARVPDSWLAAFKHDVVVATGV